METYSIIEEGLSMNVSQLYSFIVVAQNENLSKAAGMLFVSQSALSKSIAKLEEELGVPLFDRRGKKIVLNARGKRFLESSIGILQEIESTTQDLRAMANGESYKLRIGCPGSDARICDCLVAFCSEHPHASFEVDTTIEQLDYVEMSTFDMLVYPNGRKFDKLVGYRLWSESYRLAVPAGHRLAGVESVEVDDLADEDFVFIRQGKSGVEEPYRICGAQAVRVGRQFFVTSREMHRQVIGDGLALGFVADGAAEPYADDPRIKLVNMASSSFQRPLMVAFRHTETPLPVEEAFREFAIRYLDIDTSEEVGGRKNGK